MKSFYKQLTSFLKKYSIGILPGSSLTISQLSESRVYLDNAGATEVGVRAKRALMESLAVYGNPSGIHTEGLNTSLLLDKARACCAAVLNAHAYEIYFTSSGTESCNLAILGTYYGYRQQIASIANNKQQIIPHVIVSSIEHPSILEPVRRLEREGKVLVTYLPVDDTGIVRSRDILEALTEDTILVSVMYANNEIGTIQPVKEIGRTIDEWKRQCGRTFTSYPYFHTDACQAANYCNVDVLRLKVHMMTVNSSKVYGPKGSALLYKREGVQLSPLLEGGGQERGLRSGTENVAAAYAFSVALTEAEELREEESMRLRLIRDETVAQLKKEIPSIVFYGAFDEICKRQDGSLHYGEVVRLPNNINCRVPGISSEEMILRLDAKGFAVSHKSACASMETDGSYVLQALGATEGDAKENIRITMGRSTREEDMRGLVEAMKEIAEKFCKSSYEVRF